MEPEPSNTPDLDVDHQPLQGSGLPSGGRYDRFYQTRFRILVTLGAFILAAGLPIAAVPGLRHRLRERVQTLRESMGGEPEAKSVIAKVGDNTTPFPPEFERKVEPLRQPTYGGVVPLPNQVYTPAQPYQVPPTRALAPSAALKKAPGSSQASAGRTLRIPAPSQPGETATPENAAAPGKSEPDSNEPQFRQGTVEHEAYDLLLQSSATVAGMVKGNDPALHFKDWSGAKMQDESYLVRLNFLKAGAEVTYIWQVKPEAKQVMPLNFNARSLPK